MRAAFEIIRPHEECSLKCRRSTGERFSSIWHYHPEIELMFVERGRGRRFVGDSAESFRSGDLVLVGPNTPHVWISDRPPRAQHDSAIAIFVQFRENFLGRELWRAPEFAPIATLLRRSRHGIHFFGAGAREGARHLRKIWRTVGAERTAELLVLLDHLARTPEQRLLSTAGYVPRLNHADTQRVHAVCAYVRTHLTRAISQAKAAARARLSPARFSAFFRERAGCTFSNYVNHLRVAHAVRLLTEGKTNISEACYASGFNNLSNFNHRFRAIKGMSPRVFLRHFHTNANTDTQWLVRASWIR